MSGNYELGRGLRTREKNATEGGAGRFEKTAPDARAAPPEAHESLIGRKTVEEVPLTGLSSDAQVGRVLEDGEHESDSGGGAVDPMGRGGRRGRGIIAPVEESGHGQAAGRPQLADLRLGPPLHLGIDT